MLFHDISHDNNMGLVRYFLSISVVIAHTSFLAGVDLPWSGYSFVAVGGFFSLSGFLLFSSFQRKPSLKHYISRRARRILPPYVLVVVAAAVLLACISTLNPGEYYSSGGFWGYLSANLAFLNFLQPELPGVFQGPEFASHAVNGSLWTMKGEWICYLSIPLLCKLMAAKRRRAAVLLIAIIIVCLIAQGLLQRSYEATGIAAYLTFGKQFGSIFVYFFCGALINMFLPQFMRWKWAVLAVALSLVATADINPLYYLFLRPFAISTLVIWVSRVGKWGTFLKNRDDLSYDMYLFHYPMIQLAVFLGLPQRLPPLALLGLVLLATFLLALLSWNALGRHILRRPKA